MNSKPANDALGACAFAAIPRASILDGLPPRAWQGPTAGEDWYRDVLAAGRQEGATVYFVPLGAPRHVDVTGDSVYAVVPATMSFRVRDKQVMQTSSIFTVRCADSPKAGA